MKIAFIAAGAANMICGSCLRDNAVAGQLMKLGHEVTLIPLYTPIRVDRDRAETSEVFYGGANIFLQQHSSFFRRFDWFDGVFNSSIVMGLMNRFAGKTRAEDLGDLTVSTLRGDEGNQRREVLKLAKWMASEVKPEIVNLPNAMFVGCAGEFGRRTGAPVICTLSGEDIFLEGLREPFKSRAFDELRSRAKQVDGFIALCDAYADAMAETMQIPREKIHVVRLGVETEGLGRSGARPRDPFTIGYLARVAPEKGLETLIEALRILKQKPGTEGSRLRAAGWIGDADRPYLERCMKKVKEAGLEDSFEYLGEVDFEGKVALLDSLSVMAVPTVYRDPKGLFALEALAHGVPIVQPAHGGFPEMIESTDGGLLHRPEDAEDLAAKLHEIAMQPDEADAMAERGQAAVRAKFTARHMAEATAEVYEKFLK